MYCILSETGDCIDISRALYCMQVIVTLQLKGVLLKFVRVKLYIVLFRLKMRSETPLKTCVLIGCTLTLRQSEEYLSVLHNPAVSYKGLAVNTSRNSLLVADT